MNACRSCQAPVVWAVTRNGVRMPMEQHEKGAYILRRGSDPDAFEAMYVKFQDRAAFGALYQSHFVSCPDREAWRRKEVVDGLSGSE